MGIWDWITGDPEKKYKKYKERFPKPEKPSEDATQEPEEPTAESPEEQPKEPTSPESEKPKEEPSNLEAGETEKLTTEPASEEPKEPMPKPEGETEPAAEPVTGEPQEGAPELPAQETEEPPAEPVEEKDESAPEAPAQEAEEPPAEVADENLETQIPEPLPTRKLEKPPSIWKRAFRRAPKPRKQEEASYKAEQKEKTEEKEKPKKTGLPWRRGKKDKGKERAPELPFLNLLVFPITLASMLLGLSIMPLFPQPLPAILAFLIAFLTYKKPIIGMPIGGLTIGLGLMYNLSQMNFIAMLGPISTRQVFVFGILILFTALPVIFRSRKAVVSINLGIIAAILLFFGQTYFLAIPLIFTSIFLFKKTSFLTVVYYVLISVPFQIMQYLNLVLPIERWDWWIEPGTSPPIYVPLTEVFENVQESMLQFRLYDTSKVVYALSDQLTLNPPVQPHDVSEMISHYLDSIPGIVMFLFMVVGIVTAFVFFSRTFLSKSISNGERLLPTMSATVGVLVFFMLAAGLQGALAFRVDVNGVQMMIATFAALLFTLPTLMMDYTPKSRATVDMIMEKAQELRSKLLIFEDEVDEVKRNLPISTGPFEVRIMMVRDRLNDVLSKASDRLENSSQIETIFQEIDSLSKEIDKLSAELNAAVAEYQIFVNCEYSKWLGTFKDIGLETKFAPKSFQDADSLRDRIAQIKEVLDGGYSFANDIVKAAEEVYDVIRSFYDPELPEENPSIAFAKKKLVAKATPWIALDALFNAFNNWNKQYRVQISKSLGHLQSALASISELSLQTEKLQTVLGEDFPKMMENVKEAENIKLDIEKRALNVINVLTMKDVFQSSLGIGRSVLLILNEKLKSEEKAIEKLAPSEDFLWEKNDALRKRMDSAVEMTSKTSGVKLSVVLERLPKFLRYVGECLDTIAVYNYTEELLLNYPIAEKAVENLLREKKHISAEDLPFEPKYAEEYLKLFYSQKFREVSLDRTNMLLSKRT